MMILQTYPMDFFYSEIAINLFATIHNRLLLFHDGIAIHIVHLCPFLCKTLTSPVTSQ